MTSPTDETEVTAAQQPVTAVPAESDSPPTESAGDEVDVNFTAATDIGEQARDLMHRAARALASQGPPGWRRVDAVFALTVTAEIVLAVYSDDEQRVTRLRPSADVLALIRTHRERSAELGDGPWWRLTLGLTPAGHIEVDYDYGDEPFPVDHLFPPMAYQADLEVFPRARLPCWLAAYLNHDDRQLRSAATAAVLARADRAAELAPVPVDGLPPLPLLVARWGVLAGVAVAVGSAWGPRFLPSVGRFDTSDRHGGSLYQLADDRAVLSGGVWNSPALDTAYNEKAPLPQLYAGAPAWEATPTRDSPAGGGGRSI
jgi:hypothetical protein